MASTRPRLLALATATLVAAPGLLALPAAAGTPERPVADGREPVVVATGLDNPRQLSFAPGGDLYIAESGDPGAAPTGPCVVSPEFGEQCLTDSGAVTRLSRRGAQDRVLTGLPAIVSADEAVGPSDVLLQGQRLVVAFGLGGDVAKRESFGPAAARLGTVTEIPLRGQGRGERLVGDLAAHEQLDPDGQGADSNPVDVSRSGGIVLVTDAGANTVVRAARSTATVAVLPESSAPAPPFLGLPPGTRIPVQSVPTATASGPDGARYVSELTGFPFPVGGSTVWRLDAGGTPHPWATGLANVTDLAFDGPDLYAVQIADGGLLAGPVGSLVRVDPGGAHQTVVGGLFAPYGLAVRDGYAYVSTCSVCADDGTVVRVPLP